MPRPSKVYSVPTHRWYIERTNGLYWLGAEPRLAPEKGPVAHTGPSNRQVPA